jgi:thiamine-phosphate pyrophosphorylase
MQLYALCDAATLQQRGKSLEDFVSYAAKHNASIIQYRNKSEPFEKVKADLLKLRQLWDKTLIINDYIDLVPFCDGLHLGQEDLLRFGDTVQSATNDVRQCITDEKLLGISTHNEAEILEANEAALDYIGLGAFRATQTKNVENRLGDSLDKLASLSKFPVGAIGGVKLSDTFEHVTYLVVGSDLYED